MSDANLSQSRLIAWVDPDRGSLVLLPIDQVEEMRSIAEIIQSARTLGDFFERYEEIDPDRFAEYRRELDEDGESLDEPFDLEAVPGVGDGYFPPEPTTLMLDHLDEQVFKALDGLYEVHDSMGGLPWADFPAEHLDTVRSRLASIGIGVEKAEAPI